MLICALMLLLGATDAALGVGVAPGITRPVNNDCVNAKPIGDVTDEGFDTRTATSDGPGLCMTSPNLWYCYTASCTGDVTVSLRGSGYDTMLAVYSGCQCYPNSGDLIACNDDAAGSFQSEITFAVIAGRQYLIEVGGYSSETGRGILNIRCEGQPDPPSSKDDCVNAESIGDVTDESFDTRDATFDGPGLCMTSPNLWYCYTASCTGDVTVSLRGSGYDTMLAVYDGCKCDPTSGDLIECNDDAPGSFQSEITFAAIAGRQYLIEIGGYASEAGRGILNIHCDGQPGPPSSNDDCRNAEAIGDATDEPFDTRGMTFDGPGLCMTSPNIWYCYVASCTGDVTVSLLGSNYDTMLAVYNGCDCFLTSNDMIACNDDFSGSFQSQITFAAIAGRRYLIEVGGYSSETGQGVLSISCGAAPSPQEPDLGDAPDSSNNFGRNMQAYPSPPSIRAYYPTVFDDGSGVGPFGPIHLNDQSVAHLGRRISGETEADTGPDEDGENNIRPSSNRANRDDHDDGVAFPLNLPDCGWAVINYEVTVVAPGTDLWVNVWLDFNRDGDWDDTVNCPGGLAKEWAVQNQFLFNLPAGRHQLTTPAFLSTHRKDRTEQIWMRITLSEQPWRGGSNPGQRGNAGSGPRAKYEIGETEDYLFVPEIIDTGDCPLCEDVNGDGVIDLNDLTAFVSMWLANCQ
jgi:hypothetical protein